MLSIHVNQLHSVEVATFNSGSFWAFSEALKAQIAKKERYQAMSRDNYLYALELYRRPEPESTLISELIASPKDSQGSTSEDILKEVTERELARFKSAVVAR